jgi:intracellular septation protein
MEKKAPTSASGQLLVDLGPVGVFMLTYNLAHRFDERHAIFWATGVFMAATLVGLAYARFVQRRTPPMLIVTAVVVLFFGGLTLALHDALFIKIKPTIINLLYAAVIFGGLLFKQNIWKMLFRSAFDLPDKAWTILAVRWGLFFVFLAALNEAVWRNTSEAFWANFKFFGVFPLTIAFALANVPLLLKHQSPEEKAKATEPAPPAPPA